MLASFNFNLTFGLQPQIGSIKIVTVYKRSIFQVEWLIATLILYYTKAIFFSRMLLVTESLAEVQFMIDS